MRVLDSTLNSLVTHQYSKVCLVNSSCNTYEVNDNSSGSISWYLDTYVKDSRDDNVPYAKVTATYPNASISESKLTNLEGWTRLTLMEKMMNETGEYPVGNYTVEATYDAYSSSTPINMTGNKQITLKLEGFIIPEFPSLLILQLLMIIIGIYMITNKTRVINRRPVSP